MTFFNCLSNINIKNTVNKVEEIWCQKVALLHVSFCWRIFYQIHVKANSFTCMLKTSFNHVKKKIIQDKFFYGFKYKVSSITNSHIYQYIYLYKQNNIEVELGQIIDILFRSFLKTLYPSHFFISDWQVVNLAIYCTFSHLHYKLAMWCTCQKLVLQIRHVSPKLDM